MISSAQIRAARAYLDWTQEELAQKAGVGVFTIRRAETDGGDASLRQGTARSIQDALEAGGIRLTPTGGVEPANC